MAEHQHRLITGYRELTENEISLMNEIKNKGLDLEKLIDELRGKKEAFDQRWVSIGATHLQEGLMCLTRAVAKPSTF